MFIRPKVFPLLEKQKNSAEQQVHCYLVSLPRVLLRGWERGVSIPVCPMRTWGAERSDTSPRSQGNLEVSSASGPNILCSPREGKAAPDSTGPTVCSDLNTVWLQLPTAQQTEQNELVLQPRQWGQRGERWMGRTTTRHHWVEPHASVPNTRTLLRAGGPVSQPPASSLVTIQRPWLPELQTVKTRRFPSCLHHLASPWPLPRLIFHRVKGLSSMSTCGHWHC